MAKFLENRKGVAILKTAFIGIVIGDNLSLVTLVNTQIFAEDISTVLRYIRCADSNNGLLFAELALVFEINAFFTKILLT